MEQKIEFEPGLYYHEIIKANSDILLFRDNEDRKTFRSLMRRFLLPCCELVSYVILGNHAHLIIRPHPVSVLSKLCLQISEINLNLRATDLGDYLAGKIVVELPVGRIPYTGPVDHQIRTCLRGLKHSYSQYQSRKYERKGRQWTKDRMTTLLGDLSDIGRTILYIHKNPVFHGFVRQPEDWEFSSFHEIIMGNNRLVNSQKVIDLFGDRDTFLAEHFASASEFGRKPSRKSS